MTSDERPRVREGWIADPPPTVTDVDQQCRNEGWYLIQYRKRITPTEQLHIIYCERPKGHEGEHATRARRSLLWHPGKAYCLRW